MPALPKAPSLMTEWITLPQALRWIVEGIEPDLSGELGSLPSSPETAAARKNLYRCWTNGWLELRGCPGEDATLSYDESSSRMEPKCNELGRSVKINENLIRREGEERIDWEHGTFYREISGEKESENCFIFYFENLRVNWEELHKLTLDNDISNNEQSENKTPPASQKGKRGSPRRPDWPLMAALAAIIREREPKKRENNKGTCDRAGKILTDEKYKVEKGKFKPAPALEGFIREAIRAVEHAVNLYQEDRNTQPEEKERFENNKIDILSCASALASIIMERNRGGDIDITDHENIKIVSRSISSPHNPCFVNYSGKSIAKLAEEALENAKTAIFYYEKWRREHPNFRHNSP